MTPERRRKRVLVLEDEPALRGVLQTRLENEGYRVAAVKLLREALALEGEFDVLVLDRHLPNGDGVRARLKWPTALAVVISGDERPTDLPETVGFIAKPFTMRMLLDWIENHLAARVVIE